MKFRQFLKESVVTTEQLETWVNGEGKDEQFTVALKYGTKLIIKNDRITTNTSAHHDDLFLDGVDHIDWECPFPQNSWDGVTIDDVNLENFTINDFTEIPEVSRVIFTTCSIMSIKGVENMVRLEKIHFYKCNFENPIGLLRLLKARNMRVFVMEDCLLNGKDFENADDDLLSEIIDTHLNGKNIPDCQQAMVEAGFKEWAKL